jgi:hypothetical protein
MIWLLWPEVINSSLSVRQSKDDARAASSGPQPPLSGQPPPGGDGLDRILHCRKGRGPQLPLSGPLSASRLQRLETDMPNLNLSGLGSLDLGLGSSHCYNAPVIQGMTLHKPSHRTVPDHCRRIYAAQNSIGIFTPTFKNRQRNTSSQQS